MWKGLEHAQGPAESGQPAWVVRQGLTGGPAGDGLHIQALPQLNSAGQVLEFHCIC